MKLNKSSSYVLVALLNGCSTVSEVQRQVPSLETRTIQCAMARLVEMRLVRQSGPTNAPMYTVNYSVLLQLPIDEKHVIDENRPEAKFNYDLIDWFETQKPQDIAQILDRPELKSKIALKK